VRTEEGRAAPPEPTEAAVEQSHEDEAGASQLTPEKEVVSREQTEAESPSGYISKRRLRETIAAKYTTLGEFTVLCSDVEQDLRDNGITLAVNPGLVGGDTSPTRALGLIEHLDRRGYLHYLIAAIRREFPGSI
jgi:hypothetical protein